MMRLLAIILSVIVFIISAQASTPSRRALVIGLGEQLDPAWSKINGDRDVPLVSDMLRSCGYNDIRTLTNSGATKKAIVRAFRNLSSECSAGDIVYIHFSGHGQRMTDTHGDEEDGWDEAWIPYDAFLAYGPSDKGEKHLSDDEIAALLADIRKKITDRGELVVVVDACHSGDSTRDDGDKRPTRGAYDNFVIPGKKAGYNPSKSRKEDWITFSACLDYQINFEHPSGYGMLTYALHTMLPSVQSMSNREIRSAVEEYISRPGIRGRFPQSPELTGLTDSRHFNSVFR